MTHDHDASESMEQRRVAEAKLARLAETEAREAHLHQLLQAIRNINQLIVHEGDPKGLTDRFCDILTHVMGYQRAWTALTDGLGGPVTLAASSGFNGEFDALRENLLRGQYPDCMREALKREDTVVLDSSSVDCRACSGLASCEGQVCLSRRLCCDGKTFGVVAAAVPGNCAHDAEEQDLFAEIVDDLAFALRKQEKERDYRRASHIIDRSPSVAFVWTNADDRPVEFVSPSVAKLLGWTADEFISGAVTYADVIHPGDRKRVAAQLMEHSQDLHADSLELEPYRIVQKGGATRWIRDMTRFQYNEDGTVALLEGIVTDITDRKEAEENLRKERDLSDRIINDGPLAIAILNTDGVVTHTNQRAADLIGLDRAQIIGTRYDTHGWQITAPDGGVYPGKCPPFQEILQTGQPVHDIEHGIRLPDGTRRILRVSGAPLNDETGCVERIVFAIQDITKQREIERDYHLLFTQMVTGFALHEIIRDARGQPVDYRFLAVNPAFERMTGLKAVDIVGRVVSEILPGVESRWISVYGEVALTGKPTHFEQYSADLGKHFQINAFRPAPNQFACIFFDITERKRVEETLRAREGELREAQRMARLGHWYWDVETGDVEWSEEVFRIFGLDPETFHPQIDSILALSPWPEDRQRGEELVRKATESHQQAEYEQKFRRPDGSIGYYFSTFRGAYDADGGLTAIRGTVQDISERKLAEQALQQTQFSVDAAPFSIFWLSPEGRFLYVNEQAARSLGYTREELLALNLKSIDPNYPGQTREERWRMYKELGVCEFESVHQRKDGTTFPVRVHTYYLEYKGHEMEVAEVEDISERELAERRLRERESHLRAILQTTSDALWVVDTEGRLIDFNEASCRMLGYTREEMAKLGVGDIDADESPEETAARIRRITDTGGELFETTHRRKDGSVFPVEISTTYMDDEGGKLVCFCRDVSERKSAEEEQRRLQAQLNQAQKMESVGRLAGGVAHDFNNMLNVILGHANMMLEDLPADSPFREDLDAIQKAAQRSADLTRQLLAFARRQTIAPRRLDLNETVASMFKMLRRLIGEDIELAWHPSDEESIVRIDPSQVDQLLANLCVNARDAIEGGGCITIETAHAVFDEEYCGHHAGAIPGDYVMLAVSDDGHGMDETTKTRIFEPFFTTKGIGEGTGLGLATVYGIVKQNEGFVSVYSEPGLGTTFRIYLPVYVQRHAEVKDEQAAAQPPPQGSETILFVEDEAPILALGTKMLKRLGYRVLSAATPGEAIRLAEEHAGEIHLLLTDVVMPEMNGRDLAKRLLSLYPDVKRLFMSGYTADVIAHHGVLEEGVAFIQKPFVARTLGEKIREVLAQD